MRRLGLLINKVRFKTNNQDNNRFSDQDIVELFNEAQSYVQGIIVISNPSFDIFNQQLITDVVQQQTEYPLPEDIYARNSVTSVGYALGDSLTTRWYSPLKHVSSKERYNQLGYTLKDSTLILTIEPQILKPEGLVVDYMRKIFTLAVRTGQIKSIDFTGGVYTIRLDSKTAQSGDYADFADYFCAVDKDGAIINTDTTTGQVTPLCLESYNDCNFKITTTSDASQLSVGDYVTLGKRATTHSELPDNCERYLTKMVERAIQAVDSSGDFSVEQLLTKEEEASIVALYVDSKGDVSYPPVSDTTYLNV